MLFLIICSFHGVVTISTSVRLLTYIGVWDHKKIQERGCRVGSAGSGGQLSSAELKWGGPIPG